MDRSGAFAVGILSTAQTPIVVVLLFPDFSGGMSNLLECFHVKLV